jgi:hypothetical protein
MCLGPPFPLSTLVNWLFPRHSCPLCTELQRRESSISKRGRGIWSVSIFWFFSIRKLSITLFSHVLLLLHILLYWSFIHFFLCHLLCLHLLKTVLQMSWLIFHQILIYILFTLLLITLYHLLL